MQRMTAAPVVNGAFVWMLLLLVLHFDNLVDHLLSQRRHARTSCTSHRAGHHRPHRHLLRHEHLPPSARTGRQYSSRNPGIAPPNSIDDVPWQPPQKGSPGLIASNSTRPIQDIIHLLCRLPPRLHGRVDIEVRLASGKTGPRGPKISQTTPSEESTGLWTPRTQEIAPSQQDAAPPPAVSDVLGRLTKTLHQLSAVTGLSREVELPRYDGSYEAQSFFDNYDDQADRAQLQYSTRLRKPANLLQAPLRVTNTRAYSCIKMMYLYQLPCTNSPRASNTCFMDRPGEESFEIFVQRFEAAFEANGLEEGKRIPIFVSLLDSEMLKLGNDLFFPSTMRELPYELFLKRIQLGNESVPEYLRELRHLAMDCTLGEMLEVMLRDRFVAGIKSESLQKKLLQEDDDVTLDRVFSIAVSFELAEQNAKELQDGLVAKMDIVPGGDRKNEARRGWQHEPDAYIKWLEIVIIKGITSRTIIGYLREIFARFGLTEILVTDNGRQFVSNEFEEFTTINGIRHTKTSPCNPSTNGLAERYSFSSNGIKIVSRRTFNEKKFDIKIFKFDSENGEDHPRLGGQENKMEEAPEVDEELKGAESSAQDDTQEPEPGPAAEAVSVPVRSPRPQRSRRPPDRLHYY
ncbi:K02A2.6-like [Cordylochernes scorpioides]|uniref:K02A2.6-like n=1 Tax=Cordylochernes scorpioides TaxID=51811 RepID=A0ABY6LW47_9ARAC|nr:K02A2.6-like [Cordylochernes scorpioides]